MHSENKCAKLFNEPTDEATIEQMFEMQASLQKFLAVNGKGVDYSSADFKTRVDDITKQWRNMNTEMTELLDRLPWKEWKTYSPDQLRDFASDEAKLETWYEAVDVFHFFLNVCLALGIDGKTFVKLYTTKNKENFDRQKRGY